MFLIEEEPFGELTLYTLRNEDTGEYASIVPGYGAIIHRLGLMTESEEVIQVLEGYEHSEQLLADGSHSFKGNVLFPFPNRVKDGKYAFGGQTFQLPINEPSRGHALHGNLYNAPFDVVAQGASHKGAFLVLEYEADGKAEGYPFKYILDLDFRLTDEGFSCKVVVQNNDEKEMPLGFGYHPYFALSGKVDNWLLKMPVRSQLELDSRMIPTGKDITPERYITFTPIGNDMLDSAYFVGDEKGTVVTQLVDPGRNITLEVWQQTGPNQFNYLQVFTPETRQSIAIEPMSCPPDAFNNGKGLIRLQPDESMEASFGVRLK